jgi:hypothetical protein
LLPNTSVGLGDIEAIHAGASNPNFDNALDLDWIFAAAVDDLLLNTGARRGDPEATRPEFDDASVPELPSKMSAVRT